MTARIVRVVRRLVIFDLKGTHSLLLWAARRRNGVPPGGTALAYAREQRPTMMLWLGAMAVETGCLDILLRGVHAPERLRYAILVVDLYGLLIGLAVVAACITRPHVVTAGELRIRYGAFFDLRLPRDRIVAVRHAANRNESGMVKVAGERLAVAVSAQTNLVVELAEPVTVVRPLGGTVQARVVCFFADSPEAARDALQPALAR